LNCAINSKKSRLGAIGKQVPGTDTVVLLGASEVAELS